MNLFGNLPLELQNVLDALDEAIELEGIAGEELAKADAEYEILKNQLAVQLKDDGETITFINSFIRGYEEVAQKRMVRDIAESRYKTLQDKANSLKLQARIINDQMQREWTSRLPNDPV